LARQEEKGGKLMKIIKQMMLITLCFILITSIASAQGIPQATNPEPDPIPFLVMYSLSRSEIF